MYADTLETSWLEKRQVSSYGYWFDELPTPRTGWYGLRRVLESSDASASQIPPERKVLLRSLTHRRLTRPLEALVRPDEGGFLVLVEGLPVYGTGDTVEEALDSVREEIETLWEDLNDGTPYTDEWEEIRARLNEIVLR